MSHINNLSTSFMYMYFLDKIKYLSRNTYTVFKTKVAFDFKALNDIPVYQIERLEF